MEVAPQSHWDSYFPRHWENTDCFLFHLQLHAHPLGQGNSFTALSFYQVSTSCGGGAPCPIKMIAVPVHQSVSHNPWTAGLHSMGPKGIKQKLEKGRFKREKGGGVCVCVWGGGSERVEGEVDRWYEANRHAAGCRVPHSIPCPQQWFLLSLSF